MGLSVAMVVARWIDPAPMEIIEVRFECETTYVLHTALSHLKARHQGVLQMSTRNGTADNQNTREIAMQNARELESMIMEIVRILENMGTRE